jgi:5-methylcytosine-specific restriction endonuclease McrA
MKLCAVCGAVTSRSTGRCGEHPRLSGIGANHHVHADPRWARLSKRMVARYVGQYGYVCPGDGPEHPAHPTRDLTLDHVVALIDGGAPFDPANTRVLCRSRNSANGARLVNARRADRGSPHAGAPLLDVRASRMCARGRVTREIPDRAVDAYWRRDRPRGPQGAGVPR